MGAEPGAQQQQQLAEPSGKRQRWQGRWSFVLAGMGAAIGLGNLWRFPYLVFKHGGFPFLIPYLLSLVFIGIPITIMELGFGQLFQRGSVGVFRAFHPRLSGIGLAACFGSVVISWYYVPIIAYALIYFLKSFSADLPWHPDYNNVKCPDLGTQGSYFYREVLELAGDDCSIQPVGSRDGIAGNLYLWNFVLWVAIFATTAKGIHTTQNLVWFTVLVPWGLIIMFVIQGMTLDGASDGMKMYLEGTPLPGTEQTKEPTARKWTDAIHQIFFTIGICVGLMPSYGSYNSRNKPIIVDTLLITCLNSLFSLVAGFAVFSIAGHLNHRQNSQAKNVSSMALVFQSYPTALSILPGSNFFCVLFFALLVMLGFDSAFALVEGACTIIYDTPWGRRAPRWSISFGLCVLGSVMSIMFCSYEGLYFLDVVDHFNGTFILLTVGVLQCATCGFVYGFDQRCDRIGSKKAVLVFDLGFWVPLLFVGPFSFLATEGDEWSALVIWLPIFCVSAIASYQIAPNKAAWKREIWFCGIEDLADMVLSRVNTTGKARSSSEARLFMGFKVWWCFSIKYMIPSVLWFMLWWSYRTDQETPYEGYPQATQWIGISFCLFAVLLVIVPAFMVSTPEQNCDLDVLSDDGSAEIKNDVNKSSVAAPTIVKDASAKAVQDGAEGEMRVEKSDTTRQGEASKALEEIAVQA